MKVNSKDATNPAVTNLTPAERVCVGYDELKSLNIVPKSASRRLRHPSRVRSPIRRDIRAVLRVYGTQRHCGLWRGVELVRELRFDHGGFVGKRQWVSPFRINVEQAYAIFARLLFDTSEREAFWLCFDCTARFAFDKKEVIGFITIFKEGFSQSNATSCRQINCAAVLNCSTALS